MIFTTGLQFMPTAMRHRQVDPKGLPLDVQLDATSTQVAPQAKGKRMKAYEAIHASCTLANAASRNG